MHRTFARVLVIALVLLQIVVLGGCEVFRKDPIIAFFETVGIPNGMMQERFRMVLPFQECINPSTFLASGFISPPPPQAPPTTLNVIVRDLDPTGAIVTEDTFPVSLASSGTIPTQIFPVAARCVMANHQFVVLFQPQGADLVAGSFVFFEWALDSAI